MHADPEYRHSIREDVEAYRTPHTRRRLSLEELVERSDTAALRKFQDFYEDCDSLAFRDLFSEAYDLTLLELMNRAANRED